MNGLFTTLQGQKPAALKKFQGSVRSAIFTPNVAHAPGCPSGNPRSCERPAAEMYMSSRGLQMFPPQSMFHPDFIAPGVNPYMRR